MVKTRRSLPVLDRAFLKEALVNYLAKFAASEQKAKEMLRRKIVRWGFKAQKEGLPETAILEIQENAQAHIPDLVAEMVAVGALNDHDFAQMKTRAQAGRKSRRRIAATLSEKGLEPEDVQAAMDQILGKKDGAQAQAQEFQAAVRLAKKRRMGPFEKKSLLEAENEAEERLAARKRLLRQKGVFARAGFDAETAERVMEMSLEEAQAYLDQPMSES